MREECVLPIERVRRIDSRHIEFYWGRKPVSGKEKNMVFHVYRDGTELELYERKDDDEWDVGTVHEPAKRRTTVTLAREIGGEERLKKEFPKEESHINDPDTLTAWVEYKADHRIVCSKSLIEAAGINTVVHQVSYEPYYRKFTTSKMGIRIKSGEKVSDRAHEAAAQMIDILLEKLPETADRMRELHAELAIYALDEDAYDIPEHRAGCLYMNRPVEGYGGIDENPVTSISEANILRVLEGPHQTRYKQELILAHEFAHAIHLIGIKNLADQTLYCRSIEVYEAAKAAGKWPGSYAISNFEEYFATLTTIWFNVMEEGKDGAWDGVRGPVNTREELKRYDTGAYEYFSQLYTARQLPYPWDTVRNEYDIDGTKYQEVKES